ncbi:MAG: hypothetical protein ACXVZH_05700, partial [Terriglobales bacterium]
PIGMILTVLAALMPPQKHSWPSLSSAMAGFKWVGLHYIAFWNIAIAKTRLVPLGTSKTTTSRRSVTNFG